MKTKPWITALIFGLPWSACMIIYFYFTYDEVHPLVVAGTLMMGTLVAYITINVMQRLSKKLMKITVVETEPGENIIKEGGANHFKGIEGVGGRLVLTDKRLIFKSHKYNIQAHQDSFDLEHIEDVQAARTWNNLPSKLTVRLADKRAEKFVVHEPSEWVNSITKQKNLPG